MQEKPTYIPVFEDMLLALECLEDGELRKAIEMIRAYAFDGIEPEEERGSARAMFLGFKASLDASLSRIKANRANGKRRSSAKRETSQAKATQEPEASQTEAKGKPTRSQVLASTHRMQTEAEPEASNAEAKTDKTKDQGPKTKDQEEKSVARTREPPPPLRRTGATFEPPTVEEVAEYGRSFCDSKGIDPATFDPERFVDHFTSNGWKVSGRAPMRDWKASVRNWIKNDNPQMGGGAGDAWADKYNPTTVTVLQ